MFARLIWVSHRTLYPSRAPSISLSCAHWLPTIRNLVSRSINALLALLPPRLFDAAHHVHNHCIVPQCTQCDNATKLNARRCDVILQQNAAPVVNPLGCIGIHYSPPLPPRCPSMASVILSPARTNVHVSDIPHWDEQIKKWPNYLEIHAKKRSLKKVYKFPITMLSQRCLKVVSKLSERCP